MMLLILYYYTEIRLPIITLHNPYTQIEDEIPQHFIIYDSDSIPDGLKEHAGNILYTSITDKKAEKIQNN